MTRAKILPALALTAALGTLAGAGAHSATAQTAAKCVPNPNPICYQIYAPVICNNGQIYTNQCYADAACAKGCKPYTPPA